jgi:3-deoxy-manno-octulosonate cytidylyltransferase (CMP-KDO synthetase)
VDPHGENSKQKVIAVIPARFSSERLPGKMLADLLGVPLVVRTWMQVKKSSRVDRVIVATDDERIANAVRSAGGEAVMTAPDHISGSDRIAEVAAELPAHSIIVNVQGDEPLISPETIDRAIRALEMDDSAQMSTTCEAITKKNGELLNGNVVKVVVSDKGDAIYFSRSPMPFPREASLRYGGDPGRAIDEEPEIMSIFRKHTGLYVYRREYLLEFAKLPPTRLEKIEMLEQLRALENGAKIKVVEAAAPSIGVDTQADLERVRAIMKLPDITLRKAEFDDLSLVAETHVKSWQESFRGIAPDEFLKGMSVETRAERLRERFNRQPYTMLVAEHTSGEIVGFIDFGPPELDTGSEVQIYSFYILVAFQGLGVGRKLFEMSLKEMRELGHRSLCLDSLEVSPYRMFYEKAGGREVGRGAHELAGEDFETVIYGWDDINNL